MSDTVTLELHGLVSGEEAKRLFALALYRDGKVSLARAGEIAGVPREEWLVWSGKHGVEVCEDYDIAAEVRAFEDADS